MVKAKLWRVRILIGTPCLTLAKKEANLKKNKADLFKAYLSYQFHTASVHAAQVLEINFTLTQKNLAEIIACKEP